MHTTWIAILAVALLATVTLSAPTGKEGQEAPGESTRSVADLIAESQQVYDDCMREYKLIRRSERISRMKRGEAIPDDLLPQNDFKHAKQNGWERSCRNRAKAKTGLAPRLSRMIPIREQDWKIPTRSRRIEPEVRKKKKKTDDKGSTDENPGTSTASFRVPSIWSPSFKLPPMKDIALGASLGSLGAAGKVLWNAATQRWMNVPLS